MTTKNKFNPIFACQENGSEDLEKIIFHVPRTYNAKVMVHDWQMSGLAEPRDNVNFFPPEGNLRKSSYNKIGPDEKGTGISETKSMLSQIHLLDEYKPILPPRSLLNMHNFALAGQETDEDLIEPEIPPDYRTTTELDYKSPFPPVPRPPPAPPKPEPWLLNRRTVGYTSGQLENRPGINTFLDDNLQLHRRIAELKMRRNEFYSKVLT